MEKNDCRTQVIISSVCVLYIIMYMLCPYMNCDSRPITCELFSTLNNFCISLLVGIIVYWLTTIFVERKANDIIVNEDKRFAKMEYLFQKHSVSSLLNEMFCTLEPLFANKKAFFLRIAHPENIKEEDKSYLQRVIIKLEIIADLLQSELIGNENMTEAINSIKEKLKDLEKDVSSPTCGNIGLGFGVIRRLISDLKKKVDNI